MSKRFGCSLLVLIFLFSGLGVKASFLDEQLQYSRVRAAYQSKKDLISQELSKKGLESTNFQLLIKAYKYEQLVKVYVKGKTDEKWSLYKTIPFCWTSGELGPKRQEGDLQIPEGFYSINHFNPYSNFHLSLGVSYPNKSDKIKSPHSRKGGAIYMHGGCATIGCIPIEDEPIKEVYILAVLGKNNGQSKVPIHIFPFEYSEEKMKVASTEFPEHVNFWKNLFEVEEKFNKEKIQGKVSIDAKGNYFLNN